MCLDLCIKYIFSSANGWIQNIKGIRKNKLSSKQKMNEINFYIYIFCHCHTTMFQFDFVFVFFRFILFSDLFIARCASHYVFQFCFFCFFSFMALPRPTKISINKCEIHSCEMELHGHGTIAHAIRKRTHL